VTGTGEDGIVVPIDPGNVPEELGDAKKSFVLDAFRGIGDERLADTEIVALDVRPDELGRNAHHEDVRSMDDMRVRAGHDGCMNGNVGKVGVVPMRRIDLFDQCR
jgi:hypothetical protein